MVINKKIKKGYDKMKLTRYQLRRIIAEAINLPATSVKSSVYEPTTQEIESQEAYLDSRSPKIAGIDMEHEQGYAPPPSSRLGSSVEIIERPSLIDDNRIYKKDVWDSDDNNFLDNEFPDYYIMDPENRAEEYNMARRNNGYVDGKPAIVPIVSLRDGDSKVHYVKEFSGYGAPPYGREPLYFKVTDN